MKLAGGTGPLIEAVRKIRQTADHNVLTQVKTRKYEESLRARKSRKVLFRD